MSTVAEIESAIEQLPPEEQRQLETWLHLRVGGGTAAPAHPRATWLKKLARLRATISTGKITASTEAHLDDLRSERGQ